MISDANFTRLVFDGRVEHRDGQQFVGGKGLAGDRFAKVHRIEPHGFASWPVEGGIGALLQARGNRDSAYVLGGEHPGRRPELEEGGVALYDSAGGILKLVASGAVLDVGSRTLTVTAGTWTINAPAGVTITGNLAVDGDIVATGTVTGA